MYIGRQIKSLLEGAKLTGNDQWINVKESKEKLQEYINNKKEFTTEELVSMVYLTDAEVMKHDLEVKDLRFKLYFNPAQSEEIYKKFESMFMGHSMVLVQKTPNGNFVMIKTSSN